MSVTGHIKFFEKSQCLSKDGALISASSGDSSSVYALDTNPDTKWRSVSSTDLVTESLTITFSEAKTITRLLLLDINWKGFVIQYNLGGTWTHFSSVYGLDGSKSNITETVFADSTAYYEFASVSTTGIRIQITTTQTANAQKYLAQAIATSELGTLLGWPSVSDVEHDRNSRVQKTLSGKFVVQKSLETASFDLSFKNYPPSSTYNPDFDLIMTLQDREDPFLVWLCGGRRGTTYFRYILRGYRLKDVYNMQITKPLKVGYSDSIYTNPLNARITLEESI